MLKIRHAYKQNCKFIKLLFFRQVSLGQIKHIKSRLNSRLRVKVNIQLMKLAFEKRLLNKKILKVVSATFLLVCFLCLKDSTCETRKIVFYFTSKALFVLEIIKF